MYLDFLVYQSRLILVSYNSGASQRGHCNNKETINIQKELVHKLREK